MRREALRAFSLEIRMADERVEAAERNASVFAHQYCGAELDHHAASFCCNSAPFVWSFHVQLTAWVRRLPACSPGNCDRG
jgi:hypothetical protein